LESNGIEYTDDYDYDYVEADCDRDEERSGMSLNSVFLWIFVSCLCRFKILKHTFVSIRLRFCRVVFYLFSIIAQFPVLMDHLDLDP